LKVVEDCAHCIEGERDGVRPGELGDIACYSFYATKSLTSGEGGAIATENKEWAGRIRLLRLHGMSADAVTRYGSVYQHWDMEVLGWKYNMDNIHAALLVGQIGRLDKNWKRRAEIAETYRSRLPSVPSLELPEIRGKSAYHLQTVWVDSGRRDEALRGMMEKGIGVTVNYRALHTLRYFRETFGFSPSDFPVAREIGERTLSLPLYAKLTDPEVDYVVDSLKEIMS
jgi:dTDP-4-amino-4,6-dideoxygalactose transaminase